VLHLVGLRHAKGATADWASDHQGQRIERDGHPLVDRLLDGQLVVPSAKVLDERVPGDDDLGAAVLLSPPAVVGDLAGQGRSGEAGRVGRRPLLMLRCCEDNRRSDGGRRPQPGSLL